MKSAQKVRECVRRGGVEEPDQRHRPLLRARRERPGGSRAAEYGQQFPPSNGDCHTLLPCEVRKENDTTPRACSLYVRGGRMVVAVVRLRGRKRKGSVFRLAPESGPTSRS